MERGKTRVKLAVQETQADDSRKEHDLPVKARLGQVATDPAVDAQVNEGRERPDIFFILGEAAELAGGQPAKHIERERDPFAVEQCRESHQRSAEYARHASADHAQ